MEFNGMGKQGAVQSADLSMICSRYRLQIQQGTALALQQNAMLGLEYQQRVRNNKMCVMEWNLSSFIRSQIGISICAVTNGLQKLKTHINRACRSIEFRRSLLCLFWQILMKIFIASCFVRIHPRPSVQQLHHSYAICLGAD